MLVPVEPEQAKRPLYLFGGAYLLSEAELGNDSAVSIDVFTI